MTIPGWAGRRAWPALLGLAILLVAGAAAATPIALVDSRAAGFVGQAESGPLDQAVLVESYAQVVATFGASPAGLANPYLAPSVAAYFANGGQRLHVVRVAGADDASLIGADGGPGARTGLQALRDMDEVAAVAIPGAVSPAVQAALIAHCEAAGHRMAILDPVSATDPNAVMTQRSGLATTNGFGALYFPWVVAAPAGVSQQLPPSGFVAGIFARTSPPVSPAGTTNGVVATASGVSYAVGTTLQGTLNPLGINAIRFFSGSGVLAFGARTLASNLDWQYVPVRRSGSAIETSIEQGTRWALAEPNDETLWSQLRADIGDFLHSLWVAGWFQGVSAGEGYFVKCDATTMTAQDLAEGRTVVLVGFAPLSPAEFLLLRIVLDRSAVAGVPPGTPSLALDAPRPNPAHAGTTLSFELPRAEAVTMRVHDVAGRVVRTLADGVVFGAGRHDLRWDGRDDAGGEAAAGVYLVRLATGERVLTRRVSLVR